jgi:hypothetical protein
MHNLKVNALNMYHFADDDKNLTSCKLVEICRFKPFDLCLVVKMISRVTRQKNTQISNGRHYLLGHWTV